MSDILHIGNVDERQHNADWVKHLGIVHQWTDHPGWWVRTGQGMHVGPFATQLLAETFARKEGLIE